MRVFAKLTLLVLFLTTGCLSNQLLFCGAGAAMSHNSYYKEGAGWMVSTAPAFKEHFYSGYSFEHIEYTDSKTDRFSMMILSVGNYTFDTIDISAYANTPTGDWGAGLALRGGVMYGKTINFAAMTSAGLDLGVRDNQLSADIEIKIAVQLSAVF